ncbi:hypothetical protein [Chryseobacterium populi]|uniref:Uncharacterized protein n=1 Tax=Chryseobacterium populi TaxID=1144316 RepID=J2T4M2_9FLAO|nr:hypothetical protein [Chryseobacterium populi]EJL73002.1 hypothetical protein PMI13_01710 [Chryseobacterium populi]
MNFKYLKIKVVRSDHFFWLKIFIGFWKIISLKKVYYVPGLISALLIPILFWYYGNQKFDTINLNMIDIGLPAKIRSRGDINNKISFEPMRKWNYKKVKIDPNAAKANSQLYISEIKKLKERNQKETGIEFILGDKNTYGDFVSLLNDMIIAEQEEYTLDIEKTGHLFAIHSYINPNSEPCLLCNDYIVAIDSGVENNGEAYLKFIEPKGYEKFKDVLRKLPGEVFLIIFSFLILLNLSILSIKERFQMQ